MNEAYRIVAAEYGDGSWCDWKPIDDLIYLRKDEAQMVADSDNVLLLENERIAHEARQATWALEADRRIMEWDVLNKVGLARGDRPKPWANHPYVAPPKPTGWNGYEKVEEVTLVP